MYYESEDALKKHIDTTSDDKICFAIVFKDWDKTKLSFKVSLRYATIILPATNIDPYNEL